MHSGFKKGYNFVLFFIFAGALFGFALARLQYLDINGKYKDGSMPGEWYYYARRHYKIGIALHLACVVPAAFLGPFQFVPIIRYKALLFHRINGYLCILLIILGNVGALMIARYSVGGELSTQSYVGALAIMTTIGIFLAAWNIKKLQIDQHRAWMLRVWFYLGTIITIRIIMIIAAQIITNFPGYFAAMPCRQIESMGGDAMAYPVCAEDMNARTVVAAKFDDNVEHIAASFHVTFGTAGWLALWMHAIGVEIYLKLTSAEDERLRRVSYERQLERGFANPGSAGLTADRLGDVERWTPPTDVVAEKKQEMEEPEVVRSASETDAASGIQKPAPSLGWR